MTHPMPPYYPTIKAALDHYEHVGAYLRDLRSHYRLSVEDVAKRLHIRPKYIRAMEEGQIEELPGRVYTIGYLQSYGEFLGLDGKELVNEYQLAKPLPPTGQFKITQLDKNYGKPASQVLIVAGVLLMLVILGWQIFSPSEDSLPAAELIESVPSDMLGANSATIKRNERNRKCLQADDNTAFPPCYHREESKAQVPFILHPVRNQLELTPLFEMDDSQ